MIEINMKLDETDLRILRVLQKDASLSVEQLAEKVGMSRNACWRRVKHLEQEKVILGRIAVIDPAAFDLTLSAMVMIRTSEHNESWAEKFKRAVAEMPEIQSAYRMSGDLDYVLQVQLKDVKAYDRFYQRLIKKVAISEISVSFVMDDIKHTYAIAF